MPSDFLKGILQTLMKGSAAKHASILGVTKSPLPGVDVMFNSKWLWVSQNANLIIGDPQPKSASIEN